MSNKNKYFIYGGLIIVLVVILVVVASGKGKQAQAPAASSGSGTTATSQQPNIPLPPVASLGLTQTPDGQLPANFPAKLPIESNPKVLQNETISNAQSGKHDAQYIYVTKLSMSQNLAAYQKYLAANKWSVTSTVDQPEFQAINATSTAGSLSIILDYKSAAPQDQVSLSYIY